MNDTAPDLRARADRLRSARRPYVVARVVRAERPTSAHAGDSALVLDDATVIGFVGGECAEASVQAQALATLESGEPVLLRILPDADADTDAGTEPGTVTVHNPCLSGGTLEIFLEPFLPPALVLVHGDAPIAQAVRELAGWLGFDAQPCKDDLPADTAAVVVASHGGSELAVIQAAVDAGVPYVGLVASPRRGAAVLAGLELGPDQRERIHTPAGIDIGSRTPEEVALSVLAEIVSARPRPARTPPPAVDRPDTPIVTDPVCGMSVAAAEGGRHVDHAGTRHWFCGSGCEEAFRADPDAFVRPRP